MPPLTGPELQHAQTLESSAALAGIAHDLNNLLLVITANLDLALARVGADQVARGYLEDGRQAAVRAAELCRQVQAEGAPGAAARAAPPSATGAGLVLVIDDELGVRKVATKALTYAGYEVVTAADGRDGLARYQDLHDRVRLVLLDLTMPVVSGEATLASLRAQAPTLPIIIMSGHAASTPRADHVSFLAKPFRVDELLAAVAEVLAARA